MGPGEATAGGGGNTLVIRVVAALVQAVALYALVEAAMAPRTWPATVMPLFEPLLLVAVFVPPLVMLGIGQLRAGKLAVWAGVAAAVLVGLGYHDATSGRYFSITEEELFWPSWRLCGAMAAWLFVAHALVVDAVVERRLVPPYPRHFDTAWKQAVQVALAGAFVGVFWGVLVLGAGLFKLVQVEFFVELIQRRWFAIPATTLAMAVSVHVTDVQPALIRGTRTLALTLVSWLLPLLTFILLGFLGTLPLISLAPLWATHFAGGLLLATAALVVFLINCCYQDGAAEQTALRIKRLAASIGAVELVPLVGLAAWALALRVGQYGWTVDRILAAAVIVVGGCYALGYASAAVWAPAWLKRLEVTNVVTAYVFLVVVLALSSPVADPARLMVANQVSRLQSGAVHADKFDFASLRFDGARWGAAALAELARSRDAQVAAGAAQALAQARRYPVVQGAAPGTAGELAEHVTVYPAGRALPASFHEAGFWQGVVPACFRLSRATCVARFVALRPGPEAILFLDAAGDFVFEQDPQGKWRKTGQLTSEIRCVVARQGIEAGDLAVGDHPWPDVLVGGLHVEISSLVRSCPAVPPTR